MQHVFLSSTAKDLQAYRDEVFKAIQACDDLRVVRMEDFGARAEATDEFCRTKVAECDLFVGIVGHYFGSSPKGFDKSYTQQEYDAAVETNRPRLMFVTPDDFSTPANLRESTKKYKLQQEFRKRVRANQPCPSFSSPQDLATKVVTAIRNHEIAPDFAAEEKRYLAQLIERTELLEFVGIPDPRQNAAIKLEDIFVPLGAEEEIETSKLGYGEYMVEWFERAKEIERKAKFSKKTSENNAAVTGIMPHKITRRVTLDDTLRTHTRLMILGDPGAGKSTFLRYLTLVAARSLQGDHPGSPLPESRLPILIPLRRFAASDQLLVEFFYTFAKQTLQIELTRGLFEHALENGRCLVLFDGLDEVFVSDQRVAVRDAVAAFANRYGHNNRIIVTSRIVGYESAPLDRRAFAHHTILPFTEKEIESFVHRWYAARERVPEQANAQAEQLYKTIKESDRLRKLAENPLMLTIIALVHRVEAELPNERVKLYDKCTESLLSTWEGVKGLAHDRERTYFKHRRRLLEKLAFWMHTLSQEEERQAEVKRGDLKAQLIAFLLEDPKLNLSTDLAELEAEAFIELAKSRTGILIERGDGIYSFVHLTFQEYFAACDLEKRYITDLERLWLEIQPHLYDPRWREVILLLLGRLNEHDEPPSVLVEKILRERDKFDEVLHRNLFLAATCLADHVNVREPLQNEIVDALLKFSGDENPRYFSLHDDSNQALGMLHGNARASEGLLALAQNEIVNAEWRGAAAQALGQLGRTDDAVIRGLLAVAQDAKVYEYVRRAAAEALGELGRIGDAGRLLLRLAQDENMRAEERCAAAEALGELGLTDDAVRALLAVGQDEKVEASRRCGTAQTLGELGRTEDAVQLLLALAQDAKVDAYVRGTAAQTLGQLGRTEDAVIRGLLAVAQDAEVDAYVRYAAAQALGELGRTDDAERVLLAVARNERLWRDAAAQALGQLGRTDDAVRVLLAVAQDAKVDKFERIAAAQTLGQLGRTDDAVQLLLAVAQNQIPSAEVRYFAAEALGKLGRTDDAVRLLLAVAQDENVYAELRSAAARTLGELGRTDDARRLLLRLAQDKDMRAGVRCNAAHGLGELGRTDDAARLLLALAQDEKVYVFDRIDAVRALRLLGIKEPRIALAWLELSSEEDSAIRNAAYDALKEVAGNLRYAKISKRKVVGKKVPKPKSKIGNRKSKIRNHKS